MSDENVVATEKQTSIEEAKVLFFDTETSGFIKKAIPADDPEQAWCVQIGAILATQTEDLGKMNTIIQSNGREMGYRAEKVHGISAEKADADGVPELTAAEEFGMLLRQADLVVCHNFDFDWKFVQQMLERNMEKMSDEARSAFYLDLPNFCTMKDKTVKKFVQAKNVKGHLKWPKLIELHEKLFNCGFDGAHDAFADIVATKNCFYKLVEQDVVEVKL